MTTNNVQIESTISSQDHRKSSDAEKGGDVIVEDVGGPGLGRVRERHGRVVSPASMTRIPLKLMSDRLGPGTHAIRLPK